MKLLQACYDEAFDNTAREWAAQVGDNTAVIHVFAPYDVPDIRSRVTELRAILRKTLPGVPVMGCSSTGAIMNGNITDKNLVLSIMIFEDKSTRVEVMPYYATRGNTDFEALLKYARNIPDLKGIEIITAASYADLEAAGATVDKLAEEVEIFGGVAVSDDVSSPFIFGGEEDIFSDEGTVIAFYSGPELHLQTNRMFGWKPIGYPLKVTRAEGPVVYELDGKPAIDVYNHYLQIGKSSNFFSEALVFPWEVRSDEHSAYLRHAKSINSDGSIVMSSNIPQGYEVRLSFGDPRRILEHTRQTGRLIREFAPDAVYVINCMGRKLFWGEKENVEIREISRHMQTTGFSALGELLRYNGVTILNNLSLVTVAMREGPAKAADYIEKEEQDGVSNMPVTARLAIFINTITEELMEKNEQLNEMLYKASHDALTGLLNRGAIERIIYESVENKDAGEKDWYLIMFDVDDFKMINDRHGHTEGDTILKTLADHLNRYVCTIPGVEVGRWGGEEFMILMTDHSADEAIDLAELIRSRIKSDTEDQLHITISVGVTRHKSEEGVLSTINRVDELMYRAKGEGKDRVCSDL